ncbi:MAG: erv26 super protein [Vezdaea aestivalis]|nr:MAG: erv26 super protein [Vezdaea aestivalis]
MWILPLIGYLGLLLGFIFLTLAIASGLYYLSELVEEHTVPAKRLLGQLIYLIIALHALLYLLDSFPLPLTTLSIASHLIYNLNLRTFPTVRLRSPAFLASCGLVLVNHYLWFSHFSPSASKGNEYSRTRNTPFGSLPHGEERMEFREISAFFGLCVWLVPFALFVSLSAADNVLPTTRGAEGMGVGAGIGGERERGKGHRRRNTGLAKQIVGGAVEWIKETGEAGGLWDGEGRGVGRRF